MTLPLSNNVMIAVGDLVKYVYQTQDAETVGTYLCDHKDEVASALQLIADSNNENLIGVACLSLWHVCPEDVEGHVEGMQVFFLHLIKMAWENFDQDLSQAIDYYIEQVGAKPSKKVKGKKGQLPVVPDKKDVEHLKRCLEVS